MLLLTGLDSLSFSPTVTAAGCLPGALTPAGDKEKFKMTFRKQRKWDSLYDVEQTDLSVPADLDLLVVVPGVQDVLGALEGQTLLVDPLHTEHPPQTHEAPVLAAVPAHDGGHASVAL